MNNFHVAAEATASITDPEREFLRELLLEARKANSFLESDPSNLEDILSFAVMADRLYLADNESRGEKIRRILFKVYTKIHEPGAFWKKFDDFADFLTFDFRKNENNLFIVTTNYDLNIECALHRLSMYASPGFELKSAGPFYRTNGVPLFKLHGSVNWFENEEDDSYFEVVDELREARFRIEPAYQTIPIPVVSLANYTDRRTPSLIPPSFLKPEFPLVLDDVWAGAAKALNVAQHVVFVGYSFPFSDTEMMYFLASSLVNNAALRTVFVVDPQAKDIVTRLRGANSKCGSHFKQMLQPVEARWEQTKLGDFIDDA
jgi:hypothetical protein